MNDPAVAIPECPNQPDNVFPLPISAYIDSRTLKRKKAFDVPEPDPTDEEMYSSKDGNTLLWDPGLSGYESENDLKYVLANNSTDVANAKVCKNCPKGINELVDANLDLGVGLVRSDSDDRSHKALSLLELASGTLKHTVDLKAILPTGQDWRLAAARVSQSGLILLSMRVRNDNNDDKKTLFSVRTADLKRELWRTPIYDSEVTLGTLNQESDTVPIINGHTIEGRKISTGEVLWRVTALADDEPTTAVERPGGREIIYGTSDGRVRFVTKQSVESLTLYLLPDGNWLALTPDGYFSGSGIEAERMLAIRLEGRVIPMANYREVFFRPDIVNQALAGRRATHLIADRISVLPPVVSVESVSAPSADGITRLQVRIKPQGGGIGTIRVYLNQTAILSEKLDGADEQTLTLPVNILNGRNRIGVEASDRSETVFSSRVFVEANGASVNAEKPAIHALIVGINQFSNSDFNLEYAVADAEGVASQLDKSSKGLFRQVDIKLLTDRSETTKEHILETIRSFTNVPAEDVFLIYVASHGALANGDFFLFSSEVKSASPADLNTHAITQSEFKTALMNIHASKKVVILDACHAAAMGGAVFAALVPRQTEREDAQIQILSKAIGATVISAAATRQQALEGLEGHGVFTLALLNALSGAADEDHDGFVNTIELEHYVYQRVSELTHDTQHPSTESFGDVFPLAWPPH